MPKQTTPFHDPADALPCDFCGDPAAFAVESLEEGGATAYLCRQHLAAWHSTLDSRLSTQWFEPAAIGAELDPASGLPLLKSQ